MWDTQYPTLIQSYQKEIIIVQTLVPIGNWTRNLSFFKLQHTLPSFLFEFKTFDFTRYRWARDTKQLIKKPITVSLQQLFASQIA